MSTASETIEDLFSLVFSSIVVTFRSAFQDGCENASCRERHHKANHGNIDKAMKGFRKWLEASQHSELGQIPPETKMVELLNCLDTAGTAYEPGGDYDNADTKDYEKHFNLPKDGVRMHPMS